MLVVIGCLRDFLKVTHPASRSCLGSSDIKKKKNCITTVLLFTKEKWLRYLKIYKICSVPWMSQGWTLDQTWGIIFGLQSWMWNFKFKPNFNLQSPEGFGKQIILFIIHRSSSIQLPKIPSKAFMAKWYLMARIQSWT